MNNPAPKGVPLQDLIRRRVLSATLSPVILAGAIGLLVYFGAMLYLTSTSRDTLLAQAESAMRYTTAKEASLLSNELQRIAGALDTIRARAADLYAHPERYAVLESESSFATDALGVRYKTTDDGGAHLSYPRADLIEPDAKRFALKTAWVDPPLMSAVNANEAVAAGWLLQPDALVRYYPFVQLNTILNAGWQPQNFNFFYEADPAHNPERDARWSSAYLDPALRGWIISRIAPIYRGDSFAAVVGLDVLITTLTARLLDIDLPWGGEVFLTNSDGMILSMVPTLEPLFEMAQLQAGETGRGITEEVLKPMEHNLLGHPSADIAAQFAPLFAQSQSEGHFEHLGRRFLVGQQEIAETGWRLFFLIDEAKVVAPADQARALMLQLGMLFGGALLLLLPFGFILISRKSRSVAEALAAPIRQLAASTTDIERHALAPPSRILEIDTLIDNFEAMAVEIKRHRDSLRQEVAERTRALEKSQRTYRSLFEQSADGVLILEGGEYVECNAAATAILGYEDASALVHSHPERLSPPTQPDGHPSREKSEAMMRIAVERGSHRFEWVYLKADGAPIWIDVRLTRIRVEGKDLLHAVWRDITDRKQVEEAMLKARQEAEAAAAAKSDFLARMSHEIRTPMNAVIGLAHLALRTDLDPKQRDYLRKIRSSSQALLAIINDILDFSKIEAGKLTLEKIAFDLQDVLDDLINVITLRAEDKGLEVLLSLDPDVPHQLIGDPLRLGQVLVNLAINAVKFTDRGEVLIRIRLLASEQDRVRIGFAVHDTGIGMSTEQMAGLFDSFYQVDGSITRRYGGTGLGLAIAKQLVEMMDGELRVESTPGQGSVFSFEMPFGTQAPEHQSRPLVSAALRDKPVLVVDDNATARDVLSTMLGACFSTVETAESGASAIAMLQQRSRAGETPYGVVLMDLKMPGMDGLETTRRIKQDRRIGATPAILMVTAYGREAIIQQAEQVGIDGFLSKPISQSLLFDSLLNLFDLGGNLDQPPDQPTDQAQDRSAGRLAGIRGAKVLLVEDNAINQQVATELLEQVGLIVDLADNGLQGVEKARAGGYELILMDVQMPELDGLEATRRIRALGFSELPIVAMTAHAMAGDRERSLEAGMNDHLTKPIDPAALAEILLRWLPARLREAAPRRIKQDADQDRAVLALPEIEGLDTELGLYRSGGAVRLYRTLLDAFLHQNADAAERIAADLTAGCFQEAERTAFLEGGLCFAWGRLAVKHCGRNRRRVAAAGRDGGSGGAAGL